MTDIPLDLPLQSNAARMSSDHELLDHNLPERAVKETKVIHVILFWTISHNHRVQVASVTPPCGCKAYVRN